MKISAKVGASTWLYMKKFHKSQRDANPSRWVNPGLEKGYPARRVDPGWLLQSCKYLLQVDRRRVDPLRWVEANPGSCKGGLSPNSLAVSPIEVNVLVSPSGNVALSKIGIDFLPILYRFKNK